VAQAFDQQGYTVRLAIAGTIGAAWALAHFGFLESEILQSLPIAALRLPQPTVERLRRLGIQQIGQLTVMPRAELLSRFGPCLLERLDQASGAKDEVIALERVLSEFEAEWSLDFPTGRRDLVDRVVSALVGRVAAMLDDCGRGALRLVCSLFDIQAGSPATISVDLFEPSASSGHLFELVRLQLERVRLTGPVTRVRVAATASAPVVERQKKLFVHEGSASDTRELAVLIDRLTGRLGRRAVVRARLVADAQPELAWRYEPLVGSSPRRRQMRPAIRSGNPLQRPLHLVARPLPLEVFAVAPEGPPVRFRLRAEQHQVTRSWGPERIETGWWRTLPVRRDYYRVETTAGLRFWLFRRIQDGKWFLHGALG
jgi:protein ImuB